MDAKGNTVIQSTAGAVPVKNAKGEMRMEKVKVVRYTSGKRPAYAQYSSSEDSSSDEEETKEIKQNLVNVDITSTQERLDRQRLLESESEGEDEGEEEEEEGEEEGEEEVEEIYRRSIKEHLEDRQYVVVDSSDEEYDNEDEEKEEDEEAIDKRRQLMREKAMQRQQQEETLALADEEDDIVKKEESEEESSEYEEYSDSDNDDFGPRLKPVFVRKTDRVTVKDERALEQEEKKKEKERKNLEEKRKKESNRLLQQAITEDLQKEQGVDTMEDVINTDNEDEEEQYELWKVRELTRIKRDREELEQQRQEREEMDRVRNMSEEQRLSWLKSNPKTVTNAQVKGKYKFLQKYYHRGVFYLDEEDEVFKRDFAEPTLEDHFDKTVLPQVMQVKNFGLAGRTKYTHLVDQDTTSLENPWSEATPINLKYQSKGGGVSDNFYKPSRKKLRTD